MNDTYAVVNKPKASAGSAHPTEAPPTVPAETRIPSHHYDNDPAPLYSALRPRARPLSTSHPSPPLYDMAAPANRGSRAGPPPVSQLAAGDQCPAEDEYEVVSPAVRKTRDVLGFNCRIQKPRGPRDPPSEWTQDAAALD